MDAALPEELSVERINRSLAAGGHHASVRDLTATRIGTGQMAASYRLRLTFDGDAGAVPDTVVAKVPTGPVEQRALSANSYRTEIDFYRHVAPLLDARLATCHGAWSTESGDDFVLLLEDLAPREPGNQIAGCSVDQAHKAVENLAAVHGPVWNGAAAVASIGPITSASIEGTEMIFGTLVDTFLDRFGPSLSEPARAAYDRTRDAAVPFLESQIGRTGIVHGDYRLDNLLFAPDHSDVAVVDWQTVGIGASVRDLAFFLGTGLSVADRRAAEDDLVIAYHGALAEAGVPDLDPASVRADYVAGMFQVPLVIMFGSAIAGRTDRGNEMFTVMAERGAAAMADLGTLESY